MPDIYTADDPVDFAQPLEQRRSEAPPPKPAADNLWRQHEVTLLADIENANQVKDFRPIAVLPVIYKLYSRVMYMLAETSCSHLVAAQFAFQKYHQAHEVVFIFGQLVEKGSRVEGTACVHHGRGHQEGV